MHPSPATAQELDSPGLNTPAYGEHWFRPSYVSALSEARFREKVEVGRVLRRAFDKAVRRKPPVVAADGALCNFNDGKVRCRGARELCGEAQKTTRCVRELAEAYHLLSGRRAVAFCSGAWSTLNRQYIAE